MRQRDGVVRVDEAVDRRQRPPGEHVLDEPLDRGAIARALDPETLVGGPPGGDPGNGGELHAAEAGARRRLALGDEACERRRPLRRNRETFRHDGGDAKGGEALGDLGDREGAGHAHHLPPPRAGRAIAYGFFSAWPGVWPAGPGGVVGVGPVQGSGHRSAPTPTLPRARRGIAFGKERQGRACPGHPRAASGPRRMSRK